MNPYPSKDLCRELKEAGFAMPPHLPTYFSWNENSLPAPTIQEMMAWLSVTYPGISYSLTVNGGSYEIVYDGKFIAGGYNGNFSSEFARFVLKVIAWRKNYES